MKTNIFLRILQQASVRRLSLQRGARFRRALVCGGAVLALATAAAQSGGTVNFGNDQSSTVINGQTGLPVEASEQVVAALYWAPPGSATFVQLGSAVSVGTPLPGVFVGGTRVTGTATAGGGTGQFQVRAWSGGDPTYEEALLHFGTLIGQSAVVSSETGAPAGTPPTPPAPLVGGGLSSFVLTFNTQGVPPPTITCVANKTVECGSTWEFDTPAAVDGCTSNALPVYVVSTTTNGQCPQLVTQTWVATNSCDTNYATCSQVVAIVDTAAPALACAPNKTVDCGTAWSFDPPTATDAGSGTNVSLSVTATTTNDVWPRVITRTWLATDLCGNTNAGSQTVTIINTSVPLLVCAPAKTVNCTGDWAFDTPVASDPCAGTVLPVWVAANVSTKVNDCTQCFTRTWVTTNSWNSNTATGSQTVTVACTNCPLLAVTKQCAAQPVPGGGLLVFTGTVTNSGNVRLAGVTVVNDHPAPMTLIYGPATLEPGEGASFSASYGVPEGSGGPFVDTLVASGTSIYGGSAMSSVTTPCPGTSANGLTGDLNGDGSIDQNELNAVLSNYWASSQWVCMTNPASLGGGSFQFALTNVTGWNFTVLVSTNLVDWEPLPTPAYPVYQFYDPEAASNAPIRAYRLRWP